LGVLVRMRSNTAEKADQQHHGHGGKNHCAHNTDDRIPVPAGRFKVRHKIASELDRQIQQISRTDDVENIPSRRITRRFHGVGILFRPIRIRLFFVLRRSGRFRLLHGFRFFFPHGGTRFLSYPPLSYNISREKKSLR